MIVADKKREQIIEGAIKRFSHFGIGKTTMNDIADDLSVSKPSLYYYFPDKKSLILGVIEKIFNEYFTVMKETYNPGLAISTTLHNLIDARNSFFQKYYMLKITEGIPDLLSDQVIKDKLESLRIIERNFFADIFRQAETTGEISHQDMNHVSELYIESLMGLSTMCIIEVGKGLFPDKSIVDKMTVKQKELTRIFTRGLKC